MRVLSLALALSLAGCLGSQFDPNTGPGPTGNPDMAGGNPGPGPGPGSPDLAGVVGTGVSGTIASDATWSGLVNVSATVMISAGATLTVMPGTVVSIASGADIVVAGKLVAHGTPAMGVQFVPATAMASWGGLSAMSGGSIDLAYASVEYTVTPITCAAGTALCKADHTAFLHYTGVGATIGAPATLSYLRVEFGGGDGISINAGAADLVTVTDSIFHATGGDATVVNGGNLTFQHNAVYGDVAGGGAGLHCACHYSSTGTFLVDHNDFYDSAYGLMASKMGAASKVNQNNFYQNGNQYGTADGTGVSAGVDLTNNYWGGGAPPAIMGNSNTTPFATTKIAGTGPR